MCALHQYMIKYIFHTSSWIPWSKWALSRWAGADTLRSTPSAPSSPPSDTATTTNHWPRQSSAPHRPASTPPSSSRACDAALASKCGQPSEYPRSACSWWRRSCPAPCSHRSAPELSESKSDLREKSHLINQSIVRTRTLDEQSNKSINQSEDTFDFHSPTRQIAHDQRLQFAANGQELAQKLALVQLVEELAAITDAVFLGVVREMSDFGGHQLDAPNRAISLGFRPVDRFQHRIAALVVVHRVPVQVYALHHFALRQHSLPVRANPEKKRWEKKFLWIR